MVPPRRAPAGRGGAGRGSHRWPNSGPWVQVSRQANPLFNEVLIPITKKDFFNSPKPADDKRFASHVAAPELSHLLPVLYPGSFRTWLR